MNVAVASPPHASRELALQLHALLRQIDPARWRPDRGEGTVRDTLASLRSTVATIVEHIDPGGTFSALRAALLRAGEILAERLPTPGLPRRSARRAWARFWKEMQQAYQELSSSLEAWDIHVPALRPTNYARNVFHVAGATAAIAALWAFPHREVLLPIISGFLVWAWTMEVGRRHSPRLNRFLMWALGPVAHPHEWHRVNSATWYTTALFVLTLTDVLTAAVVALAVLGFGDPAAAVVGRRFGRTRLVNGRSLEGSLAFVGAGGAAALALLRLTHPEIGWVASGVTVLVGAIAGALAELFSRRIDDNLSIPLSAAAAATVALAAFGYGA